MPVLIERCPGERDLVCGGFLGWDALAALRRLGLDPAALGARPIHRLRLVSGAPDGRGRPCPGRRPASRGGGSTRPCCAMAEEAGAAVLRGRTARALDGRRVRLDDGEEMAADALFLATGKHELRGAARDDRRPRPSRSACAPPCRRCRSLAGRSSCICSTAAMPGC